MPVGADLDYKFWLNMPLISIYSEQFDLSTNPPSATYSLSIMYDENFEKVDICTLRGIIDAQTLAPVEGLQVFEDQWFPELNECSLVG